MKSAIVFIIENFNRPSISALVGACEQSKFIDDYCNIFILKNSPSLLEELNYLSKSHKKLFLCFSFTTVNLIYIYEILQNIRKNLLSFDDKKVFLISGGPHPTGDYKGTLKLGFDIVFIGEGELSFPLFIEKIINGENLKDISGIAFFDGKNYIKNPKLPLINLDDYSPFPQKNRLFSPYLEITRGCPKGCFYCQTSFLHGFKFRHRSVSFIKEAILKMKKSGIKRINLISPDAFSYGSTNEEINLPALESLLSMASETIGRENFSYGTFPSEIYPKSINKDALSLIKRFASNRSILIGAQSGSEKVLKRINRNHTLSDIFKAVELIKEVGLEPHIDFIFGLPEESEEEEEESINTMKKLIKMGGKIHSHVFMPLAGTPFFNSPTKNISSNLRNFLEKISKDGKEYGVWKRQENLAKEIEEFRKVMLL